MSGAGLSALEDRVRADLAALDQPADWVKPHTDENGARVLDVAIVGGGQSGLGAAFALRREGVRHVLALDECPAGHEGPWVTYARMITLRTPKQLTNIDLGVASLTFRAWWEAQHGPAAWEAIGKIPREDWMDYLRWYRAVLDLPVRNEARVVSVVPVLPGLFRIRTEGGGALLARKVVFATGIQGGGEWHVPDFIRALPRALYAHTSEAVDYGALAGRRIAILGGGASAFDNAQWALKAGVSQAHVFLRRAEFPRINPIRHMEQSGLIQHFPALDDARKYKVISHFLNHAQPPTNDTFERAAAYEGFRLHLGAPWEEVRAEGDQAIVETPKGAFAFDKLILSTGLRNDVSLRPELAAFAADIAHWKDRYTPPPGTENPLLDEHPYLGPHFEYLPRTPEAGEQLHGLFAFNYSALASLGLSAASLSGLKPALPRLAQGVARQLFLDDQDALLQGYLDYAEPEFQGQWPGI